jgi:CBS domain-containing protein
MNTNAQAPTSRLPSSLDQVYVSEAMHTGVFSCSADAPLRTVAQLMSHEHIHAVVVSGIATAGARQPWGIVSDLDLLRAMLSGESDVTAGQIAAMQFLTVSAGETLERAAQLMTEREATHLVVLDLQTGRAVGVLSSHDLAGVIGSSEE